uniref:STAS domain-containing protein n=1 Tax=Azohydromonas sediminis TaxID=2259674 RepID=UPI001B356070
APVVMGAGLSPLSGFGALTPAAPAPAPIAAAPATPRAPAAPPPSVEFSEVQHDPELDEAVIAFANADFDQCERSIEALTAVGGPRAQHVETWLARFDLYRATGQQDKFEALAVEYAQRFGWSAPQWFSLPRMVADAVAAQKPAKRRGADAGSAGAAGWSCPEVLDVDAVARLRSQTLQMPLPWVFDWSHLRRVEPDAATQLTELMRHWATQPLEMHWRAGDQLVAVLAEQSPTGERDADPAFWVARLEALRLANRPDQFDETAIDYCVTYEVSPPSWERAKCKLRITGRGPDTGSPPLSQLSEVTTTFADSSVLDDDDGTPPGVKVARVELSGQLIGGIDATLKRLDEQLGEASVVQVSCARLIRVDFLAAGDLLNWVLAKRGEGRQVSFIDAHRLVGLFFGAMGINEHARVRVRHV